MSNLLLINPQPVVLKDLFAEAVMYANPPLGLGYLASALRNRGHYVSVFDMGAQQLFLSDIYQHIENYKITTIGISSFIANHGNGMRIAKAVKEKYPNINVIMGGPQASNIVEEVLNSGYIDAISMFEGEDTLPELITYMEESKDLNKVLGIAFKENGRIIVTEPRPKIENLDDIAFPAWDLFNLDKYAEPGVILSGRGCPYKCIFCSATVVSGARYRIRSAKNVVDEIEYLYNHFNIKQFFMADDTFTANKEHCISICKEIRKRNLNIQWEAEARANTVTEEIASEMAKSGCNHVQIGSESGDNKILNDIGKNITIETIENAVKIFLKHGITVVCSFILGHPEDTIQTVEKTIQFAINLKKLSPNNATAKFAILTPIPGTPVYNNREKYGIKMLSDNWDKFTFFDPVMETKNLSKIDLQNLYLRAWISYVRGEIVYEM